MHESHSQDSYSYSSGLSQGQGSSGLLGILDIPKKYHLLLSVCVCVHWGGGGLNIQGACKPREIR